MRTLQHAGMFLSASVLALKSVAHHPRGAGLILHGARSTSSTSSTSSSSNGGFSSTKSKASLPTSAEEHMQVARC